MKYKRAFVIINRIRNYHSLLGFKVCVITTKITVVEIDVWANLTKYEEPTAAVKRD